MGSNAVCFGTCTTLVLPDLDTANINDFDERDVKYTQSRTKKDNGSFLLCIQPVIATFALPETFPTHTQIGCIYPFQSLLRSSSAATTLTAMVRERPPSSRRSRPGILTCIVFTGLGFIVLVGLVVLIFWLVVRPKPLEYTVDDARVYGFNLTASHALNATFDLTLRSYNRNHRVSLYYDFMEVTVWYDDQMVAFTEVAPFYQRRRNVTTLDVSAVATSTPLLGSVEKSLKHDRSSGQVGLEVRARARVRLKVGVVKTKHYTLRVYCAPVLVSFSGTPKFDRVYCDVDI
ncbi:hypothetical protein BHE74_00035691 [Ensete ventricosum]|nr:hypothetical protein BHE74_00035691 [Ensete ventricosum]